MNIIRLDSETIAAGRAGFRTYLARAACGPGSHAYEFGRERRTGRSAVVGSILECIDHGLTNEDDIVNAVTRATLCRSPTVEAFLDFLAGDDPALHMWGIVDGQYRVLTTPQAAAGEQVQTLLAA